MNTEQQRRKECALMSSPVIVALLCALAPAQPVGTSGLPTAEHIVQQALEAMDAEPAVFELGVIGSPVFASSERMRPSRTGKRMRLSSPEPERQ